MAKFKDLILTELGTTSDTYNYRLERAKGHTSVKYSFKTPNYTYIVRGYRETPAYVEISFSVKESEGLAGTTNEGNQFEIVATVTEILKEIWNGRDDFFEEADDLKGVMYSAYHKPDEDYDSISKRDKLYRIFLKKHFPGADISYNGSVTRVKIKQ